MQQLWRTAESLPCSVLNLFLVVIGAAACFIAGAVKEKSADGQGNHDSKHQNDKCVIRFV